MPPLERIHLVMAELGPETDAIASVVEGPEGTSWVIETEDGAVVQAEFNADLDRLALTAALPDPPAGRKVQTCEALLTFNLLWQPEPCVRMAMDKPRGQIFQTAELPVATLDVAHLLDALARFLRVADLWQAAIAGGCHEAPRLEAFASIGLHALQA